MHTDDLGDDRRLRGLLLHHRGLPAPGPAAWRTRSTRDISLGMFLVFSVGILLWLIYGLMVRDAPLTAANAVTLVLAVTILGLKLRHG